MKKYLFFGDSVTEAGRDKTNSFDLGKGFVYFLSQEFKDITFINKGIGGQRVKDLIHRTNSDVIDLEPDACYIFIGVNDAWLPYRLNQVSSIHTFSSDLDRLIKMIKDKLKNVEIVLIKPYAIAVDSSNDSVIKDLETFRDDYDHIAHKYKLPILDIKENIEQLLVEIPGKELFYDGIHPTKLGHQVISGVIENYIRGYLYDL